MTLEMHPGTEVSVPYVAGYANPTIEEAAEANGTIITGTPMSSCMIPRKSVVLSFTLAVVIIVAGLCISTLAFLAYIDGCSGCDRGLVLQACIGAAVFVTGIMGIGASLNIRLIVYIYATLVVIMCIALLGMGSLLTHTAWTEQLWFSSVQHEPAVACIVQKWGACSGFSRNCTQPVSSTFEEQCVSSCDASNFSPRPCSDVISGVRVYILVIFFGFASLLGFALIAIRFVSTTYRDIEDYIRLY